MPDYIGPVDNEALARAKAKPPAGATGSDLGKIDPSSANVIAAEREYIEKRRAYYGFAAQNEPRHAALALSGGGIRSASFALGVMQRLAKDDYLRLFDYLSTVSGGGYIGCSVTWLTSHKFRTAIRDPAVHDPEFCPDFGLDNGENGAHPFPYGSDDPQKPSQRHPLSHTDRFVTYLRSHGQYLIPGSGITLLSGIAVALRGILLNLLVWFPIAVAAMIVAALPLLGVKRFGFNIGLLIAALCGLSFAVASIYYSVYAFFGISPQSRRYLLRRRFERRARPVLLSAAGLAVIGTLPWTADFLETWVAETGTVALVSGITGGISTFLKSRAANGGGSKGGLSLDVLAPISGALFCYGFLLLAFYTAGTVHEWGWGGQLAAAGLMLVFSLLLGWFTNLNYITLHRYYRDRLMEAFMPDIDQVKANTSGAARIADPVPLSEMCLTADNAEARGPYHLINCHLILTGTRDKTRKARGGDSFILSPLYCGSNATGWCRTDTFFGNEITLPTAMAISGAAANPNAGSGGTGITRNPIVAIVMSLFNVRLGYWVPNPNPDPRPMKTRQTIKKTRKTIKPNHFNPGILDLIDYQRDEASSVLRLSDGGHFDNLGLYELIRRRVEFIVCCDAGADPNYAFSDLTTAVVRAEQDFGAVIKFDEPPLKSLMPSGTLDFPRRAPFSPRAHLRAKITYADGSTGTLIYLTTLIIKELRLRMLGYLGAKPDFPDETTADQFYDEGQFEAYRELGFVVAHHMLADQGDLASEPEARSFAEEFTERLKRPMATTSAAQ